LRHLRHPFPSPADPRVVVVGVGLGDEGDASDAPRAHLARKSLWLVEYRPAARRISIQPPPGRGAPPSPTPAAAHAGPPCCADDRGHDLGGWSVGHPRSRATRYRVLGRGKARGLRPAGNTGRHSGSRAHVGGGGGGGQARSSHPRRLTMAARVDLIRVAMGFRLRLALGPTSGSDDLITSSAMHELDAGAAEEDRRQAERHAATGTAIEVRSDEYLQRRRRLAHAVQRLGIGDPFPWRGLWLRQEGATSEEQHKPPGRSPGRTRLVPHHRAGSRRLGLRPRFGWRHGPGFGA